MTQIPEYLFLGISAVLRGWEWLQEDPHWLVILLNYAGPLYFLAAVSALAFAAVRRRALASVIWGIGALCWLPTVSAMLSMKLEKAEERIEGIGLLSYNVRVFNIYDHLNREYRESQQLIDFVQSFNADIKCLQEYWNAPSASLHPFMAVTDGFTKRGYQAVVHPFFRNSAKHEFGLAIFSRHPVLAHGVVSLPVTRPGNGAIWADLQIFEQRIRVYNVHLGSLGVSDESLQEGVRGIAGEVASVRNYVKNKNDQVNALVSDLEQSPYPNVLCGDLNDPPWGVVYRKLRAQLNDGFVARGAGLGGTINRDNYRWLRSDYVMSDQSLKTLQAEVLVDQPYSDHYPIYLRFLAPE